MELRTLVGSVYRQVYRVFTFFLCFLLHTYLGCKKIVFRVFSTLVITNNIWWMDGMDGWVAGGLRAVFRIAYSNQKGM